MSEKPDFFVEENRKEKTYTKQSPSGRYQLEISYYGTKKGCWNYSRGIVRRVATDEVVCDIKRNYSSFTHSFIEKNGQEYLITGRSYMSQTIINLDTGQEWEPPGDQYDGHAFCWTGAQITPDGNTLIVDGCHWACPFETRFYDFTDPSQGWPELKAYKAGKDEPVWIDMDQIAPKVLPNGDILCSQSREYCVSLGKYEDDITEEELKELPDDESDWIHKAVATRTLRREGDRMTIVDSWVSDEEQALRKARKEANERWEAWFKEFKQSDPLYTRQLALVKELGMGMKEGYGIGVGVTYKGWCPDFTEKESRITRRLFDKPEGRPYTVDLEWAAKTGPIKLCIYKDGSKHEDRYYEHSAEEMEQAIRYAYKLFKE